MQVAGDAGLSETGAMSRTVDGLAVTLLPALPYEVRRVTERPSLGVAIGMQYGVDAIASDRVRPFFTRPYSLAWLPPGCDVYSSSEVGGEYLQIEGVPGLPYAEPFSDATVQGVRPVVRELRRWLLGLGPREERPRALDRLLVLGGCASPTACAEPGALDARRLRRTLELVEAELSRALPVGELAAAVELSPDHFARAFRRAVDCTPHRYVMERRLERARAMLRTSDAPLVEIALACGFASHAHLARSFGAEHGCSPSALRDAERGARAIRGRPRPGPVATFQ